DSNAKKAISQLPLLSPTAGLASVNKQREDDLAVLISSDLSNVLPKSTSSAYASLVARALRSIVQRNECGSDYLSASISRAIELNQGIKDYDNWDLGQLRQDLWLYLFSVATNPQSNVIYFIRRFLFLLKPASRTGTPTTNRNDDGDSDHEDD